MIQPRLVFAVCMAALMSMAPMAMGLEPDELVLIANKNAPEGVKLAQYYQKKRGVPEKQLLILELPSGEDIAFDDYEKEVVPEVRKFLRENSLESKTRCLVTFYGVPIRVLVREDTPVLQRERAEVEGELASVRPKAEAAVVSLEDLAHSLDGEFTPKIAVSQGLIEDLARRANDAGLAVVSAEAGIVNKEKKDDVDRKFATAYSQLAGQAAWMDRVGGGKDYGQDSPEGMKWAAVASLLENYKKKAVELKNQRWDPDARHNLRRLIREHFGLLEYAHLLQAQSEYLKGGDTGASFDSELSLVGIDYYPRSGPLLNYLRYDMSAAQGVPMYMVMRLDAPTSGEVMEMILASIKVERDGLKGRAVVDSRGIPAGDPKQAGYGAFDEHVRQLAKFLKEKTKMPVMWDDRPGIITLPKGAPKIKDVALYCGWYEVGGMVPVFEFKPGSVGYHVASFTMLHLHGQQINWVGQMLNEGAAATLGAVSEPLVSAFPLPDDFFPLLLTGKLSLAEVYWKTVPWTSWQISMIGDPLYTPFENNPQVTITDLPARLKRAFKGSKLAPVDEKQPPSSRPAQGMTQGNGGSGR